MKVSVVRAAELDAATLARWLALQDSNPALGSPYFSPEFTLAVDAVRDDARVAVLEEGNTITGFFPYQSRWGMGTPVGGIFSDHHGVIGAPGSRWDWGRILKASGLAYWKFDHLAAAQAPLVALKQDTSPGLDLSQGFAAYKSSRLDAGGRRIGEIDRKARKLAREVGPLRFEAHDNDRVVFETVLRLKSQQCQRTGVPDVFAAPWTRALVERIRATDAPHFAGRLSALYAGDTLVAAHLGMRSRQVWHWWFPTYERDYARHSPGAQMLLHVAQAAATQGCRMLDLGKGDTAYKHSFADCSLPLVEGLVMRPALMNAALTVRNRAESWLRTSSVMQPLRPLARQARSLGKDWSLRRAADRG
jgi:CelD/BcsL family acetyltransferase involved in cellulose biosynthesis